MLPAGGRGAWVMPAIYELVDGSGLPKRAPSACTYDTRSKRSRPRVACVLIDSYIAGLWFSLKTHRDLFNPETDNSDHGEPWTVRKSVTAAGHRGRGGGRHVGDPRQLDLRRGVHARAERVLHRRHRGGHRRNAAEHWVAVLVAMKDKMDLAVNIAIGSSAQIALFVAPVLVLTSFSLCSARIRWPSCSNGFELGGILLAILIANHVTSEGESTWYEGVQLLAVYLVLGIAFAVA